MSKLHCGVKKIAMFNSTNLVTQETRKKIRVANPQLLSRFFRANRFQGGSGTYCDLPWCLRNLETWGSTRGGPVDPGVRPVPSTLQNYKHEETRKIEWPIRNFCPVFSAPTASRPEAGPTVTFLGVLVTWRRGGRLVSAP